MVVHRGVLQLSKVALLCVAVTFCFTATRTQAAESPDTHASETDHTESAGGGNPLVIDPDLAIWTALVFLGLMAVLYKFAWGPIVEALDAREQTVRNHLAAAEAQHEEARSLLAAHTSAAGDRQGRSARNARRGPS